MNKKSLIFGILAGGAIGAAASVLFAPKSGNELRKDIVAKSGEASVILKNSHIMQMSLSNPFKFSAQKVPLY